MAIDTSRGRLFVAYWNRPVVAAFDMRTGQVVEQVATCGDADDIYFDAKSKRLYVICGSGVVAVLEAGDRLKEINQLPTAPGARTGWFEPSLDRLFVALRSQQNSPAALWVYGATR